MKEILKHIAAIIGFVCIVLLALCILQNTIIFLFQKGWLINNFTMGEYLNFIASLLAGIGAIVLGIVTIKQTKYANKISNRLLDKELLDEYCFIQIEPKIDISIKHNEDKKITMSAHHKLDNGATIAIEKYNEDINKLNEYYIKLYFKDSSKGIIKELKINDLLCVQDPLKDGGFYWENDDSNCPIPCGIDISFTNSVQLNWISDSEFYTHLKVYSPVNGLFSNMIENNACSCLMFNYTITSITNVQTKILFKIWFIKDEKGKINVIYTNTNIVETKLIA